jgi:SAM-dependent methyltransferase
MNLRGIEICCPACKADLVRVTAGDPALRCVACGRTYPVVLDIPDLRLFSDPFIDMAGDRAKGQRIGEQLAQRDFLGMVDFYYSISADVPPAQAKQFTAALLGAEARARTALRVWQAAARSGPSHEGVLLDVGCGSGPLLVAAAQSFRQVVGVDIAFRWLVVAQKRLEEAGLRAPLICACAEALPFPDQSVDCVAYQSVLEHLRDQSQAAAEAFRVLRASGRVFVATPNRFSVGPDPHLGVWGGSVLPTRWVAAYARRIGVVPPHRQLVSAAQLGALLRAAGFRRPRVFLPDITPAQRALLPGRLRWLIDVYQRAKQIPVLRSLLFLIGPLLYAVASKERALAAPTPMSRAS